MRLDREGLSDRASIFYDSYDRFPKPQLRSDGSKCYERARGTRCVLLARAVVKVSSLWAVDSGSMALAAVVADG